MDENPLLTLDEALIEDGLNPDGDPHAYKDFNDLDSPMMKALKAYKSRSSN